MAPYIPMAKARGLAAFLDKEQPKYLNMKSASVGNGAVANDRALVFADKLEKVAGKERARRVADWRGDQERVLCAEADYKDHMKIVRHLRKGQLTHAMIIVDALDDAGIRCVPKPLINFLNTEHEKFMKVVEAKTTKGRKR